jgi:hypothetical protein
LLARGPRFRAEGEIIRDTALAASGLLSTNMGGPSVFPPQPAGVTTEGAYRSFEWNTSKGPDRYRRSVYTFAKRTAPFAMFATFDGPSGEACIARREISDTPLQALTLLNDVAFTEAAQALANNTLNHEGDDREKANYLFRRCLTRPPSSDELGLLLKFHDSQRKRFEGKELDPEKIAGQSANPIDSAAWETVARAVLNLDEMVTKE